MNSSINSYSFNKTKNFNNNKKIKYINLEKKSPSKYPSIYAYTKKRKCNNNLSSSYLGQYSSKNNDYKQISFVNSSGDFLERNYNKYILKQQKQVKQNLNKTISAQTLNPLLFKLKKYYNDILTNNKNKTEKINLLKSMLKHEEFKIDQIKNFQDIELPDEKISVKNFKEIKLTRDEVQKELIKLNNENVNMKSYIKSVNDYTKTVEFMFEDEKAKSINIKKETNYVLEQLSNIKKYQRIIDYNLKNKTNGDILINKLDNKLNTNNELVDKVKKKNFKRIINLDEHIEYKELEIEDLQKKLEILKNKKIDSDVIDDNEFYVNKIKEIKNNIYEKKKKEKNYIEIIYCLFILQKYFINSEFFDLKKLHYSKEYQILLNKDHLFIDDSNNNGNLSNNCLKKFKSCKNLKIKTSYLGEIILDNEPISQKTYRGIEIQNSKYDNIIYKNNKNVISINSLLKKFNELTITKNNLMDYNSKIVTQLNCDKRVLNELHNKEISLETQKITYRKKVKSIISENFQLFESFSNLDICNTNKILEVLKNNKQLINETKKKTDEKKLSQVKQQILNNTNIKDRNIRNSKLSTIDDIEFINFNSKFLYQSTNNIIRANKTFLFQSMDILKEIIDKNKKENNVINKFKIEYENIKNFLDSEKNSVNYTKERKKFINYIIDLINFAKKNENLKQLFNEEELNNKLLNIFYKDSSKKHTNKLSFNLFMLKNIPIMQNIFNDLTTF